MMNMRDMIRKFIIFTLLTFSFHHILAQQDENMRVDSILYQINDMPYIPELSGDSLFWAIVMQGLSVVPDLIALLDDTTITDVIVPNFGGFYTIADISYSALEYIIHNLPVVNIIKSKVSYSLAEELNYWSFVRFDNKNRDYLKKELGEWFVKNKEKLIWVPDFQEYQASCTWKFPTKQYPSKGYFKFEDN